MVQKVALLYGGQSGEHEVSCISARFIEKSLKEAGYSVFPILIDKQGNWFLQKDEKNLPVRLTHNPPTLSFEGFSENIDFIFPIIHGTGGEDGTLQGMLDFYRIPYAGAGVLSSAMCMDKYYARQIFHLHGLPQVKYFRLSVHEYSPQAAAQKIEEELSYPVFIKPCRMGSSVGVHKVKTPEELDEAFRNAFEYDDFVLCEEGKDIRELEIAILGNFPDYRVTMVGEIIPRHDFYSYEAKYLDENGAELKIPTSLSPEILKKIQDLAVSAFQSVSGDGFARIDFFMDKNNGEIYINEINTLPGFTPISMFPMLWAQSNLDGPALIREIINLGMQRHQKFTSHSVNR